MKVKVSKRKGSWHAVITIKIPKAIIRAEIELEGQSEKATVKDIAESAAIVAQEHARKEQPERY